MYDHHTEQASTHDHTHTYTHTCMHTRAHTLFSVCSLDAWSKSYCGIHSGMLDKVLSWGRSLVTENRNPKLSNPRERVPGPRDSGTINDQVINWKY